MSLWFYRLGDATEKGPLSPAELLEGIRNGVIQENTLVRKGNSPWVASIEVSGLWEAAGRPSAVFECPHCSKPITKPPVRCSHCQRVVQQATGRLSHHQSIASQRNLPRSSSNDTHPNANTRFGTRPGLYD